MCNDYRLEVDIASIAEDFEDLQIKIKMPEGAPNVPAREDIKIAEMAPILRSVEGERGIGELVNRRWSWPGPRGIHIICDRITDHDEMLRSIGRRAFSVAMGRGDGANHGGGPDPRDPRFPHGRTLSAPPFANSAEDRAAVVPIRSHDFH